MNKPAALRVGEVARILGVHAHTVRNEIKRGRLRAFRAGRLMLVSRIALLEYMRDADDRVQAT